MKELALWKGLVGFDNRVHRRKENLWQLWSVDESNENAKRSFYVQTTSKK